MEQQIAPTLWLPPGMCLLNPLPAMHLQPAAAIGPHQVTSQFLKQPLVTVPATNLIHNPHLLQQTHILPTAQSIVHIPVENLLLPSPGKQPYEVAPPLVEVPCQPLNLHTENQLPLQPNAALIPADPTFQPHPFNASKVTKKKRISPSAKRRSRLRLIAFLEQKRKQQGELDSSIEVPPHQTNTDVTNAYPDDSTSPPSSDDVTLSPSSS